MGSHLDLLRCVPTGSRQRRRSWASPIAALALGYLALCATARLGYRRLLYPAPPGDRTFAAPAGARLLSLHAEDGALVIAAQFPPPSAGARTIVVFHGNGETIGGRVPLALDLQRRGFGVVLTEYRGYGPASESGRPDEEGLYRDAEAILDELARQGIDAPRVTLLGISLGSGVAAEMAARGRAASLVLVSPFTSITAMARRVAPFLPVAWVCPDRFDTLSKAPRIRVPTLVIHGELDEVVPFAMGRDVAEGIVGATFRPVAGLHHNDLFSGEQGAALEGAIAGLAAAP
jgi:alpha-beta hydrolase superfamily lysophospholipase